MTTAAWSLLAVAAVAAVVDWVAVARDARRVEYVAKPLAMAALVGVAIAVDPADPQRRSWFVAAAVLSLAGDVLLMLPRDRFVAGLAAFLLAHVCYVGGLLGAAAGWSGAAAGLGVVVVMVAVVGRPVVRAVRDRRDGLLPPVVGYLVVISAMVVVAFAAGPWPAVAGAVLFYVSDGTLAFDRFVRPLPAGRVVVMTTYHLAQAALIVSLASPS